MIFEVIVISSMYVLPSNTLTDFTDWAPITEISKPPANACVQWSTLMYFHLEQWKQKFAHFFFTYCCLDGEVENKPSSLTKIKTK